MSTTIALNRSAGLRLRRPGRATVITFAAALGAMVVLTIVHALLVQRAAPTGDAAFVQSVTHTTPSFAFRATATPGGRTTLVLSASATGVVVRDDATNQVLARGAHGPGPVVITGSPGDDTLVIDMTRGNPVPAAGLLFRGEGHTTPTGNVMEIRGGRFHTATYDYSSPHDGVVTLDGTRIAYQGLQPLTNTGTAADVVFNLPAAANSQAVLQDGATSTVAELASTNHTFELTDFTIPTNSLTVNAGAGDDVTVNVTHSFGAANVTIATPDAVHADALPTTGTLTATATNGIDQPAAGGLAVGSVAAKAGTGIDLTDANAMSKLEAETDTGPISVKNTKPLTIGGVTASLHGLQAKGATGSVFLEAQGDIVATTTGDVVRAPDDITLRSTGGDVTLGGQTTVDAVRSTGSGLVDIVGVGNVFLGTATGSGNVTSVSGSTTVGGLNNTIVDYGSAISVAGGTGDVFISSSFDVRFRATGGAAGAEAQNLGTGKVSVFANTATLDSGTGGKLLSSGGDITVGANSAVIKIPINAGTGRVTIEQHNTTSLPVDLGGAATGTRLALTDTALAQVTAGVLTVGRSDNPGNMSVTAAITRHAGFATLDLETGGDITQTAGSLSVANLKVDAAGAVTVLNPINVVDTLAGATTAASQPLDFVNGSNLTVGTVDGTAGVTTNAGPLTIQLSAGNLGVQQPVTAGANTIALRDDATDGLLTNAKTVTTTSNHAITLLADRMDLSGGTVTADNGGRVNLVSRAARPINLGPTADPNGSLNLSDAELDTVTASLLVIGKGVEGQVTGTAPIDAESHYGALEILSDGGIVDHSTISVPSVLLRTNGAVVADGANTASTLAGAAGTGFCYDFGGARPTLGTIDGITGVTTATGAIVINPVADGCKLVTQLAFLTAPVSGLAGATANIGPITVQGENSSGQPTVTLTPLTVNLASSTTGTPVFSLTQNGAAVTSVTIPFGAKSATFWYGDTKSGHPVITASSPGVASAKQTETVFGGAPVALKFVSPPQTGAVDDGADLGPILLGAVDTAGNEALVPAGGITVTLSSSSTGSPIFATTFGGSPIHTITIPAGSDPVRLFYGDTAVGQPVLTATAATGLTTATQTETITAITFGAPIGQASGLHTVIYTNTTSGPVNVGHLTTTNPAFGVVNDSCSGRGLGVGGSCRAQVVFKPTAAGTQTGQLVIPATAGTVKLDLTGTGF